MSHDTLRRIVSDAYNTQSAGMTVGLPRVKVDASQLRALIAHYDSLIAERDTLRAEVERMKAERDCPCRDCRMARLDPSVYPVRREMILCPTCGNKRCPHATNHNHACTGSNDPGQDGSEYQFAWSQQSERDAIEAATIERCEQECINQRDAAQLALMRLGEHETVAIACAKSRVKQAHDCAAAMRALKERQETAGEAENRRCGEKPQELQE